VLGLVLEAEKVVLPALEAELQEVTLLAGILMAVQGVVVLHLTAIAGIKVPVVIQATARAPVMVKIAIKPALAITADQSAATATA